jgi:hypothetical protein
VGLLSALHRPAAADPDPHPGIGGYRTPRGPAGQTGYPGSTAATRENPQAAADELDAPVFRRRGGGRAVVRRRAATITAQQAQVIPAPAHDGSLPYQGPDAKINPDRVRDTEKRPRIVTSRDIPGGERQRNTVYYGGRQAIPGEDHSYQSAPKGGFGTTEVTVSSRYVFGGGPNGGTDALDDMMTARRMPYTGHGPGSGQRGPARGSLRGGVLDGNRYYTEPQGMAEGDQGGAYGKARRSQRHRPTIFAEPAPWTSEYYDTTADAGDPRTPGRNGQVVSQVHVSPRAARRGWRRRG